MVLRHCLIFNRELLSDVREPIGKAPWTWCFGRARLVCWLAAVESTQVVIPIVSAKPVRMLVLNRVRGDLGL